MALVGISFSFFHVDSIIESLKGKILKIDSKHSEGQKKNWYRRGKMENHAWKTDLKKFSPRSLKAYQPVFKIMLVTWAFIGEGLINETLHYIGMWYRK